MKVIVTGASGFLGSNVLMPLLARGHEVVAVGRHAPAPHLQHSALFWEKVDLLSPAQLAAVVKKQKADGLIHCAWDARPGAYWTSPDNLRWVAASLLLFEAFHANGGKRVVVAGSSAEYEWAGDQALSETATPLRPASLYGTSKNALRQVLEAWANTNDVSWAWGRIFNIFGANEKQNRLIPRVVKSLLQDKPIEFDDGLLYRDFLSVEEVGDAFAAMLDSDIQGPVNVAGGQSESIRDLLSHIATILKKTELVSFDDDKKNTSEPLSVVASIERLKTELHWEPSHSMHDHLVRTIDWWRTNQKLTNEYSGA